MWVWVGRDAVESGGGVVGSSYGSIAGTTVAGAVSSGRVSGLSRALCTAVAVVAEAIVVDAGVFPTTKGRVGVCGEEWSVHSRIGRLVSTKRADYNATERFCASRSSARPWDRASDGDGELASAPVTIRRRSLPTSSSRRDLDGRRRPERVVWAGEIPERRSWLMRTALRLSTQLGRCGARGVVAPTPGDVAAHHPPSCRSSFGSVQPTGKLVLAMAQQPTGRLVLAAATLVLAVGGLHYALVVAPRHQHDDLDSSSSLLRLSVGGGGGGSSLSSAARGGSGLAERVTEQLDVRAVRARSVVERATVGASERSAADGATVGRVRVGSNESSPHHDHDPSARSFSRRALAPAGVRTIRSSRPNSTRCSARSPRGATAGSSARARPRSASAAVTRRR